jgi:hypothetical protein
MLSDGMRMGIKFVGAAAMGFAGYTLVPGVKRERYYQALLGGVAGYLASSAALAMIPNTNAPAIAGAP